MLTSAKIPKFYVPNKFSLGRGGGEFQGQKSWKHDFEITGDPKCPPGGSTFWSGFEAPVGQRPLSGPIKNFCSIGQNIQKMHEIGHILVCNFYQIAVTKKISHPSFFNILA